MTGVAANVRRRWSAFWFAPDAARNLAFVRIVVAAHTLWYMLSRDYAAISGHPEFWGAVRQTSRWRYLLFEGHATLEHALQSVAIGALAAAVLGIVPRLACLIAGVLTYHLAPLETIFWSSVPYARGLTLAPVLLVLLAASRCGDALAVWPRRRPTPPDSWEYGWPRRLTWVLVAQIYLFAAYAKLVTSGLTWSSADSIRRWMLLYSLDETWRYHALGLWLAEHQGLCLTVGIATVLLEWSFAGAVLWRPARRVLVPVALLFQLGIRFAMNVNVGETWLLLTFFDVDWLRRRVALDAPTHGHSD